MEDVLAKYGEEARCFVHALQADGTGGEFDKGTSRRGEGSGCAGGGGERIRVGVWEVQRLCGRRTRTGWSGDFDRFYEDDMAGFGLWIPQCVSSKVD